MILHSFKNTYKCTSVHNNTYSVLMYVFSNSYEFHPLLTFTKTEMESLKDHNTIGKNELTEDRKPATTKTKAETRLGPALMQKEGNHRQPRRFAFPLPRPVSTRILKQNPECGCACHRKKGYVFCHRCYVNH